MSENTQLLFKDVVLHHREQKPWEVFRSDYCLHFRVASLADKTDGLDSKGIWSREMGWPTTIYARKKRFWARPGVLGVNTVMVLETQPCAEGRGKNLGRLLVTRGMAGPFCGSQKPEYSQRCIINELILKKPSVGESAMSTWMIVQWVIRTLGY